MGLAQEAVASELSYAYLHAVAAAAGCECEASGRHSDGWGVDARLFFRADLAQPALLRFGVEVQLKATTAVLPVRSGHLSFRLPREQYDKLRPTRTMLPILLVVLRLASRQPPWVTCSRGRLVLRGQAWWVSLRGAPASANQRYQQVYLPRQQRLTPDNLRHLMERLAREEELLYELPRT
jgi:hypothetical protein